MTTPARRFAARSLALAGAGILALLFLAARGPGAIAQGTQPEQPAQQQELGAQIQPGEMLVISIIGLTAPDEEMRLVRRVNEDGQLWLPLLDEQGVATSEMTQGRLQAEIRRAYQRKGVNLDLVAVARMGWGEDQSLILRLEEEQPARRLGR